MIVDANGNMTSDIAGALGRRMEDPPVEPPELRREYVPAPGRVTVLRDKVSRRYDTTLDIVKHEGIAKWEDAFTIFATVAVVGAQLPGGMAPWFDRGDKITIIPSMFDEIELSPTLTVFCGPFSAVTGKFVDEAQ